MKKGCIVRREKKKKCKRRAKEITRTKQNKNRGHWFPSICP
jgi:hypothetical protein